MGKIEHFTSEEVAELGDALSESASMASMGAPDRGADPRDKDIADLKKRLEKVESDWERKYAKDLGENNREWRWYADGLENKLRECKDKC